MVVHLNDELQRAVHEGGDRPVEAVDPRTSKVYILIERELYDRLKPLFEGEPASQQEQRDLLRRAGKRAGWDEPEMDAYDHYDEQRTP
jgi:hypothetical protein